jgi:signal peptidase I
MSGSMRVIVGTGLLLFAVLGGSTVHRVEGSDMAPSISSGDWLIALPGVSARPGDVVLLADPLDPERTVLRRAIAAGGTKVRYEDDSLRIDTKRLRHKAMGDVDGHHVIEEVLWAKPPGENTTWLIRRAMSPPVSWSAEAVEIPDGYWYLLADNRDEAVDSRWWGPVADAEIKAVVRAWVGEPHTWRDRVTWSTGHREP